MLIQLNHKRNSLEITAKRWKLLEQTKLSLFFFSFQNWDQFNFWLTNYDTTNMTIINQFFAVLLFVQVFSMLIHESLTSDHKQHVTTNKIYTISHASEFVQAVWWSTSKWTAKSFNRRNMWKYHITSSRNINPRSSDFQVKFRSLESIFNFRRRDQERFDGSKMND